MGNVTQYPAGLLDLLKVRDRGQMPSDLNNVIAPTLDVGAYMLNNVREIRLDQETAPVAAAFNPLNDAGQLVVPPGELWYVHHYTCSAVMTALTGLRMAPAIRTPGNVNAQLGFFDSQAVGAISLVSTKADDPFWALPGTEFGCLVSSLTGVFTIVAAAHITRLRL